MKYFSTNLAFLRKKLHKGQADVAADLGFRDRRRYSNYETGHSKPDLATLQKIAAYFGVEVNNLLNLDLSDPTNLALGSMVASEPSENYGGDDTLSFYKMHIHALELRIKALEALNYTLSTNFAELETNNKNLLMALERKRNNVKVVAPAIKNKGKR
jgi:transcriptional regulator with XRE-family HTH domain